MVKRSAKLSKLFIFQVASPSAIVHSSLPSLPLRPLRHSCLDNSTCTVTVAVTQTLSNTSRMNSHRNNATTHTCTLALLDPQSQYTSANNSRGFGSLSRGCIISVSIWDDALLVQALQILEGRMISGSLWMAPTAYCVALRTTHHISGKMRANSESL